MLQTRSFKLLLLTLFLSLGAVANAQFNTIKATDFEEGRLPSTFVLGMGATQSEVLVDPYSLIPQAPNLTSVLATDINKGHGLQFAPSESAGRIAVYDPSSNLNRDVLQGQSRALFELDVYIPDDANAVGSVAIIAEPSDVAQEESVFRFYRFGILNNDKLFFSFTNGGAAPELYRSQPLDNLPVNKPGWNRLQLLFLSNSRIEFAINGEYSSFSPINEATFRNVKPGIMVTGGDNPNAVCIVDNFTLQWSPGNTPLPYIPWAGDPTKPAIVIPAAAPSAPVTAATPTPRRTRPTPSASANRLPLLSWGQNYQSAVNAARDAGKPLLICFSRGPLPYVDMIERISNIDARRSEVFDKYVLLSLDLAQSAGSQVGSSLGVSSGGTLAIVSADGQLVEEMSVGFGITTWPEIRLFLDR